MNIHTTGLNFETFQQIKGIFTELFDELLDIYSQGSVQERDELTGYLARSVTSNMLFRHMHPANQSSVNNEMFSSTVVREFYLELLERWSISLYCVSSNALELLIVTLSKGSALCKAVPDKNRQTFNPDLEPILTSFHISESELVRGYKASPWLVVQSLLILCLAQTKVGQKVRTSTTLAKS